MAEETGGLTSIVADMHAWEAPGMGANCVEGACAEGRLQG